MNVMYAADDNYAEIMAVSILSLIESNRSIDEINFYIVEDQISQGNIDMLRSMIEENGRKAEFILKPDIRGLLGVELSTLRWSDSAYSRLFLKELFGEAHQVKKLIYIDCDTLIVGSLEEVWNEDIDGFLGAGCLECMSNMHKKIVGAKKADNYLNTGFLVFNVEKWIKEDIQTKVSEFIRQYKGKTEYVDQGVINGTVSNQFKLIDPRYNLTALAFDFSYEEMLIYRKPQFGYEKDIWEKAKKNPVTIHFTTSFLYIRPWFEGSKHPYAKIWKKIHDRTPWKDMPYRELKNRKKRDRHEELYRKIPRWLAVRVAGFLHAFVKPIVYKIRCIGD